MLRDAIDLTDTLLTADVCIVGAGAAGITLAIELEGQGLRVLLLESGGLEREEDTQELYEGSQSGQHNLGIATCRLRWLGGSTNAWAGWCRRLEPEDFEERSWMPNSGWPISLDDLSPHYDRAHEVVGIGAADFDAEAITARSDLRTLALPPEAARTVLYQYSAPTRFGQRYRSRIENSADIELLLHANLIDIRLGNDGQVDALECGTLTGVRFEVKADRYVLAAGGIENARALLSSNRQEAAGIGNANDLVGRYFMEHPHFYKAGWLLVPNSVDVDFYAGFSDGLTVDEANPDGVWNRIRGALSLPVELREQLQTPVGAATLVERELNEVLDRTGYVSGADLAPLLRAGDDFKLFGVDMRAEQRPVDHSRVRLSSALDPFARPRADVAWNIATEDIDAMHRTLVHLGAVLGAAGVGRMWIPTQDGLFRPNGYFEGCHHMGTTRMSNDAKTGVVDADLRVHGLDTLYVLGSSVFPTGGFANPTLTIVALAVRLADHLARELP